MGKDIGRMQGCSSHKVSPADETRFGYAKELISISMQSSSV